ncbi:hypothetical protein E3N88_04190 [Mikania micrantha]|uniref:Uncharacterized protein n=1 Tax=Mikania micrantha TaxID=192012 RepID=A0A5N6PU92_9ASTR|nr:hypothetical protein E3N88_04190 [Mikania micrantha]
MGVGEGWQPTSEGGRMEPFDRLVGSAVLWPYGLAIRPLGLIRLTVGLLRPAAVQLVSPDQVAVSSGGVLQGCVINSEMNMWNGNGNQ